jgi:hypothetical protein
MVGRGKTELCRGFNVSFHEIMGSVRQTGL